MLDWGFTEAELQIDTQDYSEKNKEIDVDDIEEELDIECPKCHFRFKR